MPRIEREHRRSVELEARIDLVCVVSCYPFGLSIADGQINSPAEVTELDVAID